MFNLASTTRIHMAQRPRRSFTATLEAMFATAKQRRALAEMDMDRLDDIGISQSEAHEEAGKPFWDVPSHWMR